MVGHLPTFSHSFLPQFADRCGGDGVRGQRGNVCLACNAQPLSGPRSPSSPGSIQLQEYQEVCGGKAGLGY